MPARTIYKLLTRSEWEDAQAGGVYRGSSHDWRDGFIHFSTAAQLGETARKYFTGEPDLVLLAVDVGALDKDPLTLSLSPGEKGRWNPSQSPCPDPSDPSLPLAGEGQDEGRASSAGSPHAAAICSRIFTGTCRSMR